MLQHISIEVLANWVTMLRADRDGAILLSDDEEEARFYEKCAHEKAQVIPAPSVALPLLQLIERRGLHGVVAALRGDPNCDPPNIFRPSLGDVASLLLLSSNCDAVIRDICGDPWLKACDKELGPIRQRAAWAARVFRSLPRLCVMEGLPIIGEMAPSEIIDWSNFELSWEKLNPILDGSKAIDEIRSMVPEIDLRRALSECDGMDATIILAAATEKYQPRGIRASAALRPTELLGALRIAFDLGELEQDEIYWRMRRWERTNVRYPLLRQWRTLDPLRVVWDQRYWESDLSAMLGMLAPGEELAILKMDLDNFKQVNDILGHIVGDDAIRLYCGIVKRTFGVSGDVHRRGGDEVVVLAPWITENRVRELAEKTRSEIENEFRHWATERGLQSAPTASIGLTLANAGSLAPEIVRLADDAQGQAKQQGKNRVVVLP